MKNVATKLVGSLLVVALSACAAEPSLPLPDDDLSAPAAFMQDYAPGEGTADDCYAPTCSLPGAYGVPHKAVDDEKPTAKRLGDPYRAIMLKMEASMPVLGGGADRDFLAAMIPHHKAAVEMSAVELAQGRDPDLRALAATIRDGQARELMQMQVLLDHHAFTAGETDARDDYMHAMHDMHAPMPPVADPDEAFARAMLPHHTAALAMADVVLEKGRDPNVRRLALDILGAQRTEMAYMNVWLNKKSR